MSALSSRQPYPGLRPFDTGDEAFFFGRAAQTRGLHQKLEASRLVAVVGRSGCGKSSLVRAGLVPLLRKEGGERGSWHIVSFRPQGQPIAELTEQLLALAATLPGAQRNAVADADARGPALEPDRVAQLRRGRLDAMLRRSSRGLLEAVGELDLPATTTLLIVVDQFEEIFRFEDKGDSNADEAIAFVRLLLEAILPEKGNIRVMLTMRLDFLGDCARFPRLPEAISDGQFLVPTLSRAERRAAIEEPARTCGVAIHPAVTQRLLNEIGDDPDRLPVLQHVLMRTWQQAQGAAQVTLEHYKATGEVANAISRHADEVLAALPDDAHRDAAERMFKAISELDRRGRAIRRPVRLGELAAIADAPQERVAQVVEAFRAPECCFLMPPAGEGLDAATLIDISHESLLRGWRRMTGAGASEGWLAEEDRDGRTYRNLLEAARDGATLPPGIARERQAWWRRIVPNRAWAERYGGQFEKVRDFLESSASRARYRRIGIYSLVATIAIVAFLALLLNSYRIGERQKANELAARNTQLDAQFKELDGRFTRQAEELRDAREQLKRREAELGRSQEEFARALESARRSLTAPVAARDDINRLIAQNEARLDDSQQRLAPDSKRPSAAPDAPDPLVGRTGFMWIGSKDKGYLRPPDGGAPVPATAVERGREYLVASGIYLRAQPPERPGYAQAPAIGSLDEGTRVQLQGIEPPYPRPHGDQYWAQVKVIAVPPPTVYFQFAGGSREQALQVSKALREKGYAIPGEERTALAAGKRVVRYFDEADRAAAQKLANSAQQVLQDLGFASRQPVTVDPIAQVTKSNPDGNLELWIEIPPK